MLDVIPALLAVRLACFKLGSYAICTPDLGDVLSITWPSLCGRTLSIQVISSEQLLKQPSVLSHGNLGVPFNCRHTATSLPMWI